MVPPDPSQQSVAAGAEISSREVESTGALTGQPAPGTSAWPPGALEQAMELHRSLQLGDRQWHALKHQKGRRGAEQISAALLQLLHDPRGTGTGEPERRAAAVALLEQGMSWLKGDLKDPGCPTHGR